MRPAPHLTVLIPFFNEGHNVMPVLEDVFTQLGGISLQVICIDDASTDDTAAALVEAQNRWPEQVVVRTHVARRGKSAALWTGLHDAQAEWVQLLDGDGQNNPADTARVLARWTDTPPDERLALVAGRRQRRNDGAFKWLQSRIANGIRRVALGDHVSDTGCGWKLIRADVFRILPYFASMHRYLPALVRRAGWDVVEEPVDDRARRSGQSKYGFLGRASAGVFDLLGVIWLVRRGTPGIARETNDPRADEVQR